MHQCDQGLGSLPAVLCQTTSKVYQIYESLYGANIVALNVSVINDRNSLWLNFFVPDTAGMT